jgi:tetratricopeptide (TPR) repeat protein
LVIFLAAGRLKMPLRWRTIVLAFLVAAAATSARADAGWDACIAAPTRACMLDLAAGDIAAMEDRMDRAEALADLALARFHAGLASEADGDFAKAAQELQRDDAPMAGYGTRPIALGRLAIALAEAGRIDDAIRTVGEITINDGGAARALTAIATAQAKAGRAGEAAKTRADAFARVQAMTPPYYGKVSLLRALSDAQRASGLVADAERTLAQARDMAVADKTYSGRDLDLAGIAKVEAAAGDIATALQTAALVSGAAPRDATTLEIFRVALAAGKLDVAKPIPPTLSGVIRATAFDEMATAFAKAGRKAEADEALASARQAVAALPAGTEKVAGYSGVAGIEKDLGDAAASAADTASARALLDGLVADAKGAAAVKVVSALARTGRIPEAFALADAMSPDFSRDAAHLSLAQIQAAAGDFPGALRATREVTPHQDFRPHLLERLAEMMGK